MADDQEMDPKLFEETKPYWVQESAKPPMSRKLFKEPTQQDVAVRDVTMPFWSMVRFLVKLSLAAIPALIIVWLIGLLLAVITIVFLTLIGVRR